VSGRLARSFGAGTGGSPARSGKQSDQGARRLPRNRLWQLITGPYTAVLLADLGAEVIKVERPGTGDPFRSFEEGLYGPQFLAFNRNKKSIVIDLHDEADRSVMRQLIAQSDVLIENHRPGVMARLGFEYPAARAVNPRLVYCSISGFGPDGAHARRPAYDTVAQGASGYLSLFLSPQDTSIKGPAVADAAAGLYAAYGILGALFERHATGRGRLVEVSMMAAMAHFASEPFQHYFVRGILPEPQDRARTSQSFAFGCADGKIVAVHLSSPPKFWTGLLAALERPDLAHDPRFATRMGRVHHHKALEEALRTVFVTRPRDEWVRRLTEADVPHAPVLDLQEVLDDPQAKHLGIERRLTHPTEGPVRTIANPVVYDRERGDDDMTAPPVLDQHGAEIRAWLAGLDRARRLDGEPPD
jgi:crotonobetainyl-CoA:carnitine CoA-transferase CaiB-like acyl-CoA transferase